MVSSQSSGKTGILFLESGVMHPLRSIVVRLAATGALDAGVTRRGSNERDLPQAARICDES